MTTVSIDKINETLRAVASKACFLKARQKKEGLNIMFQLMGGLPFDELSIEAKAVLYSQFTSSPAQTKTEF